MTIERKLLFIDIDHCLVGKRHPRDIKTCIANGALEFLAVALEGFECSWLSTHSQPGELAPILEYLSYHAANDEREQLLKLASRVRPSGYRTLKTEALHGDFLWLDDSPLACELEYLRERGWFDRWIQIDTFREPDALYGVVEILRKLHS